MWPPGGPDPPLCGMVSLQGRARGMMECWHTKAERLPAGKQAALREKASPTALPARDGRSHPGACGLTEVGLLVCSFEVHPFGGRLDEEVADKVTAVLSWTEREESVSGGESPEPGVSPPDPPAPGPSGGSWPIPQPLGIPSLRPPAKEAPALVLRGFRIQYRSLQQTLLWV